MGYWSKELLKKALPNAAFYNFNDVFCANGIRVSLSSFVEGALVLVCQEGEKKGIPVSMLNRIANKAAGFITTSAKSVAKYELPIIEVENCRKTLFQLARYKRARFPGKVIDITGSAGKSTTTKMCYDVLSEYGACANLNQANTNFGLSWNMTTYDQKAKFWINETSLGGGMSVNSLMTMPNIAAITNIAPVHLRPDQKLMNVVIEKSKIFDFIKPDGTAILYREMLFFDYAYKYAQKKVNNIITFGESDDSDIRIIPGDINYIEIYGNRYKYNNVPTPLHILLDAGIVAAILHVCGLPIEPAFEKLNNFRPLAGRGAIVSGLILPDKNVTLVDESFNANPLSMKCSLQGFNKLFGNKLNKLLILGDMAEGGPETWRQHLELYKYIDQVNPSRLLLCGKEMLNLWNVIGNRYYGKYYENADKLIAELMGWVSNDDYILVKGSHSVELYKVVEYIKSVIR